MYIISPCSTCIARDICKIQQKEYENNIFNNIIINLSCGRYIQRYSPEGYISPKKYIYYDKFNLCQTCKFKTICKYNGSEQLCKQMHDKINEITSNLPSEFTPQFTCTIYMKDPNILLETSENTSIDNCININNTTIESSQKRKKNIFSWIVKSKK